MKKRILFSILMLTFLLFSSICCSAAPISPAIEVLSHRSKMSVSCLLGNDIRFNKDMFKEQLGCKVINKLIITDLPDKESGVLTLDGLEISQGREIESKDISKLVFHSSKNNSSTTDFSFRVFSSHTDYQVQCSLFVLDSLNFPPVISSCLPISTFKNVCRYSSLTAIDPEGDAVIYEIYSYPSKGELKLTDSKKGTYCYTPYENAQGKDSFELIAKDSVGNSSLPQRIDVSIEELTLGTVYSDINGRSFEYAATALSEKGIFCGEIINNQALFYPQKEVSIGEFLAFALSCARITPSTQGSLPENITVKGENEYIKNCMATGYRLGYLDTFLSQNAKTDANSSITIPQAISILNSICSFEDNRSAQVFFQGESGFDHPGTVFEKTPLTRGQCALLLYDNLESFFGK